MPPGRRKSAPSFLSSSLPFLPHNKTTQPWTITKLKDAFFPMINTYWQVWVNWWAHKRQYLLAHFRFYTCTFRKPVHPTVWAWCITGWGFLFLLFWFDFLVTVFNQKPWNFLVQSLVISGNPIAFGSPSDIGIASFNSHCKFCSHVFLPHWSGLFFGRWGL